NAFAATGEPESVGRRRRNGNRHTPQRGRQHGLGFCPPSAEPWPIRLELHGNVADRVSLFSKDLAGAREEHVTVCSGVLRMRGAEVLSDVAEPGSSEQGVNDRVSDGVTVGVPGQRLLPWPLKAG